MKTRTQAPSLKSQRKDLPRGDIAAIIDGACPHRNVQPARLKGKEKAAAGGANGVSLVTIKTVVANDAVAVQL